MAETKIPALKNIPAQIDTETKLALESMKEALEVRLGRRGDPKDRAVTHRDLVDSGLATDLAQEPYNPNIAGATGFAPLREKPGDVAVPPAPTVLSASGLFTDVLLSWNQSTNTAPYGNHAFTEIWRSQSEDLSSAVLVGTTSAFIYTDKGLEYNKTYYYWVRFVSTTNTPGPWSNMASAITIENISATMASLSETIANMPGYSVLTDADTATNNNVTTLNSSVTSLTSTVNGHTSSISSISSTQTNQGNDISAMYVLKVTAESNGTKTVAGMLLGSNASDGSSSSVVAFTADKFAIWNDTNASVSPFIVDSNVVYIDQARIKDGAILDAKIGTLNGGKIIADTITATQIAGATITATQIATDTITATQIAGTTITASEIAANAITTAKLDAGAVTAVKITTTDLVLPTNGGSVSGSTIGNFNNNSKRYAQITSVGSGAGFYQGYVRLVGGTGQVKTIHLLFSDGTVNTTETSGGTDTAELLDSSSGVVYRTPDIEHLNTSITQSRLTSSADTANIPIAFRHTGSGTVTCYIYGQGDGGTRQIGSADVRFVKFSAN